MNRLSILGFLLVLAPSARATEPCRPETWFANQDRTGKEWARHVRWVAVGKIVHLEHDIQPYPNCGLEDRSKCATFNNARLTLEAKRMEKGKAPAGGKLELAASFCARDVPVDLDTALTYRFFGDEDAFFVTFEPLPAKQPKGRR